MDESDAGLFAKASWRDAATKRAVCAFACLGLSAAGVAACTVFDQDETPSASFRCVLGDFVQDEERVERRLIVQRLGQRLSVQTENATFSDGSGWRTRDSLDWSGQSSIELLVRTRREGGSYVHLEAREGSVVIADRWVDVRGAAGEACRGPSIDPPASAVVEDDDAGDAQSPGDVVDPNEDAGSDAEADASLVEEDAAAEDASADDADADASFDGGDS